MDFGQFEYLENFDFIKYFEITAHSLQLDNSQWKISEILDDIEKGFSKIKCSICVEDAIWINLIEETCFCEEHAKVFDSCDDKIATIERIIKDFKQKLTKMEKYLIFVQERDHFIRTEKLIALMNKKNQEEIENLEDVLGRKIKLFHHNVESLIKGRSLDFFFKVKTTYDEMKTTAFDIFKIIATLLIERCLESLFSKALEDMELDTKDSKPKEEIKSSKDKDHFPEVLYSKALDILTVDFISAKKVSNFDNDIKELYKYGKLANGVITENEQTYSKEIENLKHQLLNYKELYEKEKEEWLAQRTEIEHELKSLKDKLNDKSEQILTISYDVFNALYKDFIGESITLNSSSGITFNLKEEKWRNLLRVLNKFKLPQIEYYQLDFVPSESKDVKDFMRNSIPVQKIFYFNSSKKTQIDCSKYFEELKLVAQKTTDHFCIYNTNFSAKEYQEIVSSAKSCKNLLFQKTLIPLDSECDFGLEMEGNLIDKISFDYSGSSSYSNWYQNPTRFENLIAAIAKFDSVSKKLKILDFTKCEIEKVKVEEVMKKYNLKGIKLICE